MKTLACKVTKQASPYLPEKKDDFTHQSTLSGPGSNVTMEIKSRCFFCGISGSCLKFAKPNHIIL